MRHLVSLDYCVEYQLNIKLIICCHEGLSFLHSVLLLDKIEKITSIHNSVPAPKNQTAETD